MDTLTMNENEMNLNQDDNDIVPERPTREKCEVCNQAERNILIYPYNFQININAQIVL
jgi:hypothetical protein